VRDDKLATAEGVRPVWLGSPIPNLLSVRSQPSFAADVTPSDISYQVLTCRATRVNSWFVALPEKWLLVPTFSGNPFPGTN